MESSGQADFKTVPGFAFRKTFKVDIEGFTPLKVMLATTVYIKKMKIVGAWAVSVICEQDSERCEEFRMLSLAFLHK